jgi:putative two-component system response regulator
MPKVAFSDARILLVDDQAVNLFLLEEILENEGYTQITSLTDPRDVFAVVASAEPDLILLDLMMPEMSGFEVMDRLSVLLPEGTFLPILILTADVTPEAKRHALAGEAMDFLTKPFDHTEAVLRIRNLLTTRFFHLQLRQQNQLLDSRVRERTQELAQAQSETLIRLARAAEYRDYDTGQHTQRVGHTSALIAEALGLPAAQVMVIGEAAPLHDVGKIGIPDQILLKPGKLTPEEFITMQAHTSIGSELLGGGCSELIQTAERIALTHHERWDGTGYPLGLSGEALPIEGRIVAVADVFDALTHGRPYKVAWTVEEAVAEIVRQSGRQFDPRVVEVFLELPYATLI